MAQGSPRRTAEELKDPQFNYFIAFDFEITETNPKQIEQTVKMKLSQTQGSNIRLRRLLELKDDILQVMCNDAVYNEATGTYDPKKGARKAEAARATESKLDEAVEIIQDMCSKSGRDFILISDLENIRTKAKRYFSLDELKGRIAYLEKQGVKIIDNVDKTMPFNEYKKIEENLTKVKKRDLYDFLGVPPDASTDAISKAHDATYSTGTKTNDLSAKQAVSGLCASAKTLLMNSDKKFRTNYDYYLKLKESVFSKLELRKTYGINLSMDEYEEFVQVIVDTLGVKLADAERILAVGCKFNNIYVSGKVGESNFDTCPYCNKIYKKGEKSCPHCGKPLEILCWNCQERMAYSKTNQTCPVCGASHQSEQTFQVKSDAIDALLRQPQSTIAKLETALLELKNVIPNYAQKPQSFANKKISGYEDRVKERKNTEEKLGSAYREDEKAVQKLIAEKKYYAAEGKVRALKSKYNTYNADNTAKLLASITAETAKAQQVLNLAKTYMAKNDSKSAIANAVKALDICDDCGEARSILQKYPPMAPLSLRATVSANAVKLDWTIAGAQDFVSYTVIKKVGIAPTSADDGSVVTDHLSIAYLEDSAVVSATKYFYAVFAERYGIKSKIVVTQAPPIYADVTNVHQEVVNDCIKVAWSAPQNVKEVQVRKLKGNQAPDNLSQGDSVTCDLAGFTDPNVLSETSYLIVCVYQVDGKPVYSRGVRSVLKPYRVLNAVKNASLQREAGARFQFIGQSDDQIKLFYSEAKLAVPIGKTQRLTEFGTITKGFLPLTTSVDMEGNTMVTLPEGKLGWVYPVAQNDQLFIIAEPIVFNTIKGQNLKYSVVGGTLTVTGSVSDKADTIVLKVSSKDFPKTMQDDGDCFRFKREEFVKNGKIELKLKTNTISYVSVFTEFKTGSIVTYAEPFIFDEALGEKEKVQVKYKLDFTISPTKAFKMTILFESDVEVKMPAILLMKGRPRPLNKTEGELVERVEGITLKKGMFAKKYTAKCVVSVPPAAVNMKYIIFPAEDKCDVKLREVLTM